MSVILLITAGVLLGNARNTKRLDPGIQTGGVLQLAVADRARGPLVEQLRGHPAVDTVATARWAPLDGGWWVLNLRNAQGVNEASSINIVSPEYFGAVRLPLLSGRSFTTDEALGRVPVVIVSEAAARRFWPDRDPIGETLELSVPRTDTTLFGAFRIAKVIGVVRNATPGVITRAKTWPSVYYPLSPTAPGAVVLARTRGTTDLSKSIVASISAADSTVIDEAHSLSDSIALQMYPFRVMYWLATAVGCIALLLTISGVYGVVSYLVGQRRKEFGIRMALGAATSSIVALVLRQSLASCAIGIAVGVFVALGVSKILAGVFYVTNAFDVVGYLIGVVVVVMACFAATYVPSRRAAAIDPVTTLRADS